MNKIEHNIKKMYLFKSLKWFLIVIPIIVLFFQDNGLSMKEVMLLQTTFSLSIIIFEVPSGYFSDVLGRKYTLVIGSILACLGFIIYSFSFGFWGFFFAELTIGLGSSFVSGTDSALLYDTLIQINKEEKYKIIEGKMISVGNFSEAIASMIGGITAGIIGLRGNIYIEIFILFISILVAFSLVEPETEKRDKTKSGMKDILKIVKYSLIENKDIRKITIFSTFVNASTLTQVWFIQPFLKNVGLPITLFGFAWATFNFSVGIFSFNAYKFEEKFGNKKLFILLSFMKPLGYFLMGIFPYIWGIAFIFIFYFVRGVINPLLKNQINNLITSDMRATVLSLSSLLVRIIFSIVGPFIGWITDKYSLNMAMICSGFIFLTLSIIGSLLISSAKLTDETV